MSGQSRAGMVKEPLIKSWMSSLSPEPSIASLASTYNSPAHKHISIDLENSESQSVSPRLNQRLLMQLVAALFSFIFFSTFSWADNDASVEAARAAAHAAEAAREGTGIPALSEGQAAAYLDGRAMWMASVAELNSYPNPRQVLEFADKLGLSTKQQQAIKNLYDETRSQAIRLGKQLVTQEQRLNRVFAWGQATTENIKKTVADIGVLQAKLRLTHLLAHIRTKELLTKEQVKGYDELQGKHVSTGESNSKIGCNAAHHHGR